MPWSKEANAGPGKKPSADGLSMSAGAHDAWRALFPQRYTF